MRRLILIRHAKAEAGASSDRARALTARGHRDAAALGRWLADSGLVPDLVLVSSARRTRDTWQDMTALLGEVATVCSADLYSAHVPQVLALIGACGDEVATLAVVGHNPTMHELAALLLANDIDRDALTGGFPTAAAAIIDFPAAGWEGVAIGTGRLASFVTPDRIKSAAP